MEAFESAVTEAKEALEKSGRPTAAGHIHEALQDLSRRPQADLAGAVYHAAGAELLYLPPYSPDFNPIEKAYSKINDQLRSAKSRTLAVLEKVISQALPTTAGPKASAWFSHCGYGL